MSSNQQQNFQSRLFRPQALDIEQIMLHMIDEIGLSAVKVAQLGDATQANTVFIMLVLNLDNFIFPILTADGSRNWDDYKKERKSIYDTWPDKTSAINEARQLYKLSISILAKQRLFKVKRYSSFGIGWQQGHQIDMENLNKEDEGQDEEIDEG